MVDGAIVPTSIGVNSSLTISALAFKIAENIVPSSVYLPIEPVTVGPDKFTSEVNLSSGYLGRNAVYC